MKSKGPRKKTSQQTKDYNDTLDLHIEKLEPSLVGKRAELILIKQLQKAKEFIELAIAKNQFKIILVHGKGSGALKMEIDHMLEDYTEIFFTKRVNAGGAVEVLFKY